MPPWTQRCSQPKTSRAHHSALAAETTAHIQSAAASYAAGIATFSKRQNAHTPADQATAAMDASALEAFRANMSPPAAETRYGARAYATAAPAETTEA